MRLPRSGDTLQTWSPGGPYAVGPANGGVVNVSFVTGYSEFEEKHGHGEGSEPKQSVGIAEPAADLGELAVQGRSAGSSNAP